MNNVATSVPIVICADAADAIKKGYDHKENGNLPISLEKIVVVKNGMQSGKSSFDFIVKDADGKQYVFIVTKNIMETVASL